MKTNNINIKSNQLKKILLLLFICLNISTSFSQQKVELKGVVLDEFENPIAYAAIGIPSKQIGTATNDDGAFSLKISSENIKDILEVSTIGFKTYKIKIEDYINNNVLKIVLIEEVVSLAAITLEKTNSIVKKALKKVKNNTLSSKHQINMLYRRSSVENGKTRFMVEHYLNILDYGPSDNRFDEIGIAESRKSADYRFAFKKQPIHAVYIMGQINPLRQRIYESDYNWERDGDTSYDGEDILIIRGTKKDQKANKKENFIKLYIGMDTYSVYKIDVSRYGNEFSNLKAFYIYKKDNDGQLVLSYHNREAKFRTPISEQKRKLLKLKTRFVQSSYRHEGIVLNIESDKKKFNIQNTLYDKKDIGDYDIKYNPIFWKNIALPPATKFYKKSVKELESIYGVSLEDQFKSVNK
ncbi:carboxypeptidase-like regulatory domain-containing protein [uncultured Polaribacter sp.]|uniref:carboxypeptidase-like regulatory domain-containing protein n=1 Tax=uncultured Polaribacter sp. TaxID=174711 RepID=UPI0026080402|nr:carboxypeptidase-like regulatory domain-containing protein [uncultured Polaribacter sp.]